LEYGDSEDRKGWQNVQLDIRNVQSGAEVM
jgi:hypothetical protein